MEYLNNLQGFSFTMDTDGRIKWAVRQAECQPVSQKESQISHSFCFSLKSVSQVPVSHPSSQSVSPSVVSCPD